MSLPRPGWDGRHYHTPNPELRLQTARDFVRWRLQRRVPSWSPVPVQPRRPARERVGPGELVVHWVGHSTLLLQVDGVNILCDPIWSAACGPWSAVGPRRVAPPGIVFDHLPPIDAVLLSHDHYDHFCGATLRRLIHLHAPRFFAPSGVGARLARLGAARVAECSWWEGEALGPLRFVAVPAQHHSGRAPNDRFTTLWCGWVVESSAGNVYFAGDTGWWEAGLTALARHWDSGAFRLAALPIGAYAPRWFMQAVHIDPAEAVDLFELLGARQAVAIHHATFQLSDEPIHEPAERLRGELLRRGIDPERFRALEHGQGWNVA